MYHVHDLQPFSKDIQIECDPLRVIKDELDNYPDEEKMVVKTMIERGLRDNLGDTGVEHMIALVHVCIPYIRNVMQERAVVSYRDVERLVGIGKEVFSILRSNTAQKSEICIIVTIMVLFCLRLPSKAVKASDISDALWRRIMGDTKTKCLLTARGELIIRLS